MFEDIFLHKRAAPEKLFAYGFSEDLTYETDILDGMFRLRVRMLPSGGVDTDLTEIDTGEPYTLYKTSAVGSFLGEVRGAVETVLTDIAARCCEPAVFRSMQAETVIRFVRETWGDALEFLWERFPDNAIWRRRDNEKWYGLILTVAGRKLGLDTDEIQEILVLRMDRERREEVLSRPHHLPAWHMNKNSWYTLVLNDSVPDAALFAAIRESYALAGKQR